MPLMHKLGSLTPIVYFVNHTSPAHVEGYIMLAAYSAQPMPPGYSREYADTLAACYALQKRLQEQTRQELEREGADSWNAASLARQTITERLRAKLVSSATSEHDKAFIRDWLKVREDRREHHARQFECRNAYIRALEDDLGDRAADSEEVNVDRIG